MSLEPQLVSPPYPLGRFAPSPTGDLHMGSLMAAVASFLAAKVAGGRWLLRIEDVDRPRQVPGAAERIIADLARFGFEWDGPIVRQSARGERYQQVLDVLIEQGLVYPCSCSRREVQAAGQVGIDGPVYPGFCRDGLAKPAERLAWRFRVPDGEWEFTDPVQGRVVQNLARDVGDFVVLRADGCWAYQLAVVVDDADFGINQIVRGADLLDSTPRQLALQAALGVDPPDYMHIPVISNERGEKLSKQTLAPVLQVGVEAAQLFTALRLLHQHPPLGLEKAALAEVWAWALENWNPAQFPQRRSCRVATGADGQLVFI